MYVSGDNASLELVREIAGREGPFDVALLFAGAARTPLVPDATLTLTLTSEEAAEAAVVPGARHVVPLHFEHWGHFTQDGPVLTKAFAEAGPADRLHLLSPGESVRLWRLRYACGVCDDPSEAATVQGADRRRDFV